jgi:hypothetical protein
MMEGLNPLRWHSNNTIKRDMRLGHWTLTLEVPFQGLIDTLAGKNVALALCAKVQSKP